MAVSDDGPGRLVSRDEPYYAPGLGPDSLLVAHCHLCSTLVPVTTCDYRWFVMRAIKIGWKLAKLTTGDEWTCPACGAVARANLDAVVREDDVERDDE